MFIFLSRNTNLGGGMDFLVRMNVPRHIDLTTGRVID